MSRRPSSPRAALVAVQVPPQSEAEVTASLTELEHLCAGLGLAVVHRSIQKRPTPTAASLLGAGKLEELARLDAETVAVDLELSPGQLRHLQVALGREVLDRTDVILRVFEARAQTRLARVEIEIARLLHEAPRIRDDSSREGREGGGGRGGRGHTNAELARQRLRERVALLRREAAPLRETEVRGRSQRGGAPRVALIGYTNAGKSSLMRALTGSEVLVEDRLFATLATTVRALRPETVPRILVSDTVGFIRNLSHALIASFRSTLDEARDAGLLLFVVDASDPELRMQLDVTRAALRESGAEHLPTRIVLNKIDLVGAPERAALAAEFPEALQVSAYAPASIARLREVIIETFLAQAVTSRVHVPFTHGRLLGELRASARVLHEAYDALGVLLTVQTTQAGLERLKRRGLRMLEDG